MAASSCPLLETGTQREGIWEKGNGHEVGRNTSKNSKGRDKSWSWLTLASSVIFFIYICILLGGAECTHGQNDRETNDTDLGEERN